MLADLRRRHRFTLHVCVRGRFALERYACKDCGERPCDSVELCLEQSVGV